MDKYKNFKDLENVEGKNGNFDIKVAKRDSNFAIIAIHGGNIEPGTMEIARKIAGKNLSFYTFIGKKENEKSSQDLHITSTNFDEPKCINIVENSKKVISIHGESSKTEDFIMLGGLDDDLISKIKKSLEKNNFVIKNPSDDIGGISENNICNKCISGKGVQFEISRKLRDRLLKDSNLMDDFIKSINEVIEKHG